MIKSFKYIGLNKYLQTGSVSGTQAKHQGKFRTQLNVINSAQDIDDINLLGFKLYPLKGGRDGI